MASKRRRSVRWWMPESIGMDVNEGRVRLTFYPVSGNPFGIMLSPEAMLELGKAIVEVVPKLAPVEKRFIGPDGKPFDAETQKSINEALSRLPSGTATEGR